MIERLIKGVGANVFDKLVVAGVQLTMVPVLAVHWGPKVYGIWLLLSTIPAFLAMGDFGFATAAGVDMTMQNAAGNRDAVQKTFQSAWLAVIAASVLIVAAMTSICLLLPDHFFGEAGVMMPSYARTILVLLAIYGVIALQGSLFLAGFRCCGLYAFGALSNALLLLCEGSAVIVMVIVGASPMQVAIAYPLLRLSGIAVQAVLLRYRVPWLKLGIRDASTGEMRRLLGPASAVMALPLAQASFLQGTALAVGAAAGVAAVPAFVAVRTLSRIGIQMTGLVNRAVMPEFSTASARNDHVAQSKMILLSFTSSALFLTPIAIVLFAFGPRIVQIWTHGQIHASWALVAIMTGVMLLNGLWQPLSDLILSVNRQHLYSFRYAILAALSVPVSYVLARGMGAAGGALAILLLDTIMLTLILRIITRLFASPLAIIATAPDVWRALRARVAKRR